MSFYVNTMANPSAAHTAGVTTLGTFHMGDRQYHDGRTDQFRAERDLALLPRLLAATWGRIFRF